MLGQLGLLCRRHAPSSSGRLCSPLSPRGLARWRLQACRVAVVSTYPPKNCGVATFTAALLDELRDHGDLPPGCSVGVVALADPSDELTYRDPIVHYDLRYDLLMPSPAMLEAVHFIHKAGYSHVIIQQARLPGLLGCRLARDAREAPPEVHLALLPGRQVELGLGPIRGVAHANCLLAHVRLASSSKAVCT